MKATIRMKNQDYSSQTSTRIDQTGRKIIHGRVKRQTTTHLLWRSSRLMKKLIPSQLTIVGGQIGIPLYQPNSALGKDTQLTKHSIDFVNFKILDKDSRPYRLLLKESIEIRSRHPALNNTYTFVPIYVIAEGYQRQSKQQSFKTSSFEQ